MHADAAHLMGRQSAQAGVNQTIEPLTGSATTAGGEVFVDLVPFREYCSIRKHFVKGSSSQILNVSPDGGLGHRSRSVGLRRGILVRETDEGLGKFRVVAGTNSQDQCTRQTPPQCARGAGEDGHHAFTAQKSSPQRRICLYSGYNNLQRINSHALQPESPAAMRRIWLHWAVNSAREQLGANAVAMRIGDTSRCMTCLLAMAGDMPSRWAAATKLFSSATMQKTRMPLTSSHAYQVRYRGAGISGACRTSAKVAARRRISG